MAKNNEIQEEERQAFIRACEKNGVLVRSTPRRNSQYFFPIIIGKNGERYMTAFKTTFKGRRRMKNICASSTSLKKYVARKDSQATRANKSVPIGKTRKSTLVQSIKRKLSRAAAKKPVF